jgi:magnesium transporter
MLSFHAPSKTGIEVQAHADAIPCGVNWIDALRPDAQEIAFLEHALGIEVPTLEAVSEIETSSRLRSDGDWLHLSIPMVYRRNGSMPVSTPVGFSLSKDMLLTIRFEPLRVFDHVLNCISRVPMQPGGLGALIAILEGIVGHTADILEKVGADLDLLSQDIFATKGGNVTHHRPREDSNRLRILLREIGRNGDLSSKIEDSLLWLARMLPFVMVNSAPYLDSGTRAKLESLQRDVESLNDYETHLTDKNQLLLDATVGLTNVDQNNIFRILTIVSVVGIPPTFFASMWGMNFKHIPEYNWTYGYEFGLFVIALSAIIPIIWFKWRGWW